MYFRKNTAIISTVAVVAVAMLFATGPLVANNVFAHSYHHHYYHHHHHHYYHHHHHHHHYYHTGFSIKKVYH